MNRRTNITFLKLSDLSILLFSMLLVLAQAKAENSRLLQSINSICYSDGKLYEANEDKIASNIKPLFGCSWLNSPSECGLRCSQDVCTMNCPILSSGSSFFGFEYKCYSDGKLYNNTCEAECRMKDIFELFSCKNSRIQCSRKCKKKQRQIEKLWQKTSRKDSCASLCGMMWDPACSVSGQVFDNNCLLQCHGEKRRFYCSQKGLSFDANRCKRHCKRVNRRVAESEGEKIESNLEKSSVKNSKKDKKEKKKIKNNQIKKESLESKETMGTSRLNDDFKDEEFEIIDLDRLAVGKNSFQTIEIDNDKITVLRNGEKFDIMNEGGAGPGNVKIKETDDKRSQSQVRSSSRFGQKNTKKMKEENFMSSSKKKIKENRKKSKPKKMEMKQKEKRKSKTKKKEEGKQQKRKKKNSKNKNSLKPNSFKSPKECLSKCKNKNKSKIVCFSDGRLYINLCKAACNNLTSLFICSPDISMRKCLGKCRLEKRKKN